MFRILFWNVHGHALESNVARLIRKHGVDLVLLAESGISAERLLEEVGPVGRRAYWNLPTAKDLIQMFTRVAPEPSGPNILEAPTTVAQMTRTASSGT